MRPVHHESVFGDAIIASLLATGGSSATTPTTEPTSASTPTSCSPSSAPPSPTNGTSCSPSTAATRRGASAVSPTASTRRSPPTGCSTSSAKASRTAASASGSRTSSRPRRLRHVLDDYRRKPAHRRPRTRVRDQAGRLGQPPRPHPVPQRHPRRHRRAEEPADRPGRRARQGAVPHRPRPHRADLHPPGGGELRRRPGPGLRRHPAPGKNTRFLPFNTGSDGPGKPGGAGNPPPTPSGAYATSYLWEQVWQRDNWLDLLERFMHPHKSKTPTGAARRTHRSSPLPPVARGQEAHRARRPARRRTRTTWSWRPPARASPTPSPGSPTASASLHTPADPAALDPDARRRRASSPASLSSTRSSSSPTAVTSTPSSGKRSAVSNRPPDSSCSDRREATGRNRSSSPRRSPKDTGKIVTVTLHSFPALRRLPQAQPDRDPGPPVRDHRGRGALLAVRRRSHRCTGRPARPRPGRRLATTPGAASAGPPTLDAASKPAARRRGQSREPLLLRVHRHAQDQNPRTLRHPRTTTARLPTRSTPTRCGRRSRKASSSTRCATTSPTTRTGNWSTKTPTSGRSTRRKRTPCSPGTP